MFSTPPADPPYLQLALMCKLRIPFSHGKKVQEQTCITGKKRSFLVTFGIISPTMRGKFLYFHFSRDFLGLTNKNHPELCLVFVTWPLPNWHEWASTKSPPPLFLQSRLHPWVNNVPAPDRHRTGWRGARSYRTQECLLGTIALFVHLAKVRKQEWSLSHVWKWGDWPWQHVHRQTSAEGHACHCEWGNDNGSQSVSHLHFGLQEVR